MTRTPPEVPAKPLRASGRDVWSDDRARWFRGFAWGAFPGTFIGITVFATHGPVQGVAVFLVLTLGVGGVTMLVSESAGALVRGVTNPRGRARPGDHSRVDALVARGEPEAALDVLRASLDDFPDDVEAWLRIARIERDETGRARAALVAFRRARSCGSATDAVRRTTIREMLEVARGLGQVHLVTTDLEAHREAFGGTSEAGWASDALSEVSRPGDASAS